jgi:hypothetical protein
MLEVLGVLISYLIFQFVLLDTVRDEIKDMKDYHNQIPRKM